MLAEHGGRSVRIRALPIGIPFAHFESLAKSSPIESLSSNSVKVILGVDRLDYTKGNAELFILGYIDRIVLYIYIYIYIYIYGI